MSMEAVWDLQAKASPRSLAVFSAVASVAKPSSSNPFDAQQPNIAIGSNEVIAVTFGTDRGSIHYRTYATGQHGLSTPQSQQQSQQKEAAAVLPLGRGRNAQQIPRHYLPIDLQSLPGPIVACVPFRVNRRTLSSSRRSQQQQQQQQNFLLLIDDGRGATLPSSAASSSSSSSPSYASMVVASNVSTPGFQVLSQKQEQRMACAAACSSLDSDGGGRIIYGLGQKLYSLDGTLFGELPAPGVRSGQDALCVTAHGKVAVAAVGNTFYAVAATAAADQAESNSNNILKLLSFQQSSQVHPIIAIDLLDRSLMSLSSDQQQEWSSLFLASGRECAVVDLCYNASNSSNNAYSDTSSSVLGCSKPRNGSVMTPSPILAAAAAWPWVAVLTSDGLISIRSPSCLAIPLRTVEVGQRPNDYFVLRSLPPGGGEPGAQQQQRQRIVVAAAHSGECKVLHLQNDSAQDLADRLMRHAIDAFGAAGFPRAELADAVSASFTATSYAGPEATPRARILLKQYLEAVLGLADFESGASSGWPTEFSEGEVRHGTFAAATASSNLAVTSSGQQRGGFSGRGLTPNVVSSSSPAALLTGTALLCLVCSQLTPPHSTLASKAAQSCAEKMGVVFEASGDAPKAAIQVCEQVAEKLLREASSKFSLAGGASPTPITATRTTVHRGSHQSSAITDFIEAAIWLLRSCGKHERAIEVAYERLQQQGQTDSTGSETTNVRGVWSKIKYESYTATHLSEIWGAGRDEGCRLVLASPATHRLLEDNPRLGLSVFTAMHPQNTSQWRSMAARDDPLAHPDRVCEVLKLLKSINPSVVQGDRADRSFSSSGHEHLMLPLESSRAVAVSFLRSAIGISTGRLADDGDEFDSLPVDADFEEHVANFHDELSFILLEGVILERPENETDATADTELGEMYRSMLRELLKWPLAKIRPDHFMDSLPPAFLQEKALVLGRLGRHEDALRILYRDLKNLDLALEYCDDRYAQQKEQRERQRARQQQKSNIYPESDQMMLDDDSGSSHDENNAYLPLLRVALESENSERGTATAIKVLALRRGAIDRAAALRLLPSEVPVSAVARPFLIPALVDGESQVRRMTVVSALLRSRYLRLKEKLTTAQLRAQSNIHVVPALRSLNLGNPLHSSKSFRARTISGTAGTFFPDVQIVKHFFPRHLVIQAKVTNVPYSSSHASSSAASAAAALYASSSASDTKSSSAAGWQQTMLSDIAFVVAESSEEEAIQPLLQVPIQLLPPKMTGSSWCVLSASPGNMEGSAAQLTCELRYSVQSVADAAIAVGRSSGSGITGQLARTYVEELQDLEVLAAHFSL